MLLEVEELCFWKWKSCAFGSRRVVQVVEVWKSCVFRSGRVVLLEVEELCFSEWKSCASCGSEEELLRWFWKRES